VTYIYIYISVYIYTYWGRGNCARLLVYPRYWLTLVTLGKTVVACTIARTVNRCGGCLFRPDGYKVVPSYKYPHNLQFTRYNYHKPSKTQQLCEIHQLSINPEKAAISTTYTTYIYISMWWLKRLNHNQFCLVESLQLGDYRCSVTPFRLRCLRRRPSSSGAARVVARWGTCFVRRFGGGFGWTTPWILEENSWK